jgi:PAS domain S-box-containing protein
MTAENPVKRLHKSIVLSSAAGIFCVGVIVAVASILPLYEYLKKEEERTLVLALNAKTTAVEEYLSRAKDIASQIASRTIARRKLAEYNAGLLSREKLAEFTRDSLLDAVNYSQEVWGISRLDLKGSPVTQVGLEVPESMWPVPDLESGDPGYYGPVTIGPSSYLVVRAPILDRKSERLGTDIILFRLFHLQRIIQDYTGLGMTGETILGVIREDKAELIFPSRNDPDSVPDLVPLDSPLGLALLKAGKKRSGTLLPGGLSGKDVIAFGPVRNIDWGIAVLMNQEELYAPVNQQLLAVGNIIVVLILLGTLGMIFLVRPLAGKMIVHTDELGRQIQEKTASLQKELSERRRMMQWLRDSERRYRTLVEEVPDVIFLLDHDGRFTYANTQIEVFLEYPVEKILETSLRDYVVPEDQSLIDGIFELTPDTVWDGEVAILDAKENRKFARIRCKFSAGEDDALPRYEGVMRDITRRRSLEEEVKTSRQELLEKIRIIDDLYEHIVQSGKSKAIADHTAEVAHELRQPLAIIGGFARRMARQLESPGGETSAGQKESCYIMVKEIKRLEKILDSLIDFTRHEKIHLKLTDPNRIIEQVLLINQGRIADKNLRIEINLGGDVEEILLDPDRFEQVVRNLVANAVEASPAGGVLTIETGFSIPSDKAQETGGLESETYFEMKIKNYGKIIPADELQKIFSPFFTTKDYGTGIGLTLAKKIAENHSGSISVKSDRDGTVFTLWIPALQRELVGPGRGSEPSGVEQSH